VSLEDKLTLAARAIPRVRDARTDWGRPDRWTIFDPVTSIGLGFWLHHALDRLGTDRPLARNVRSVQSNIGGVTSSLRGMLSPP
jgi:hypothetical protein